ncbi:RICIN domain-containing protein [Microbacterium sp. 22303]|uniref:RICIN domain-containing protein n=1 Tax=Microbacterium sp. 22303 TaxID=3453905 RepID=UPI003F84E24F
MLSSTKKKLARMLGVAAATTVMVAGSVVSAQAYDPSPDVLYELGSQTCLKGTGNCVIYPKSTQLPSGRLLVSFEKSTIGASGSADGQTVPVMKSDDYGVTWQPLADVAAPAYLSDDPAVAPYISNWTNPYLYVLPEDIGHLKAGTVLLATVVSGEDEYFVEKKAADPNWIPTNDGDRRDLALALYSSTDEGATWSFENIIAKGGWQGGSAGNIGKAISSANTHAQVDPLWEPHLDVHDGELVAYYSDENDYIGFDQTTGIPVLDPDNDTAKDSHNQILVHRTWDGGASGWSETVVDVAGLNSDMGGGKTIIGGGRPGMTTVAKTTDDKWLLTFEYFGGGSNVRYKISDDPLNFYSDGDVDGLEITQLPAATGSRALARGGSPVVVTLPDGRIAYNAAGSANVWINQSGRSDGAWTELQSTVGTGYSRTMQYVEGTGRIVLFQGAWGGSTSGSVVRHAEVDFGQSDGAYYQLENKATGQVLGTNGRQNDANIGNSDRPDVRAEAANAGEATQQWHVVMKPDGNVTLLNRSGGRAAAIWTGNATVGQRIGQWVDEGSTGVWKVLEQSDGSVRFQSVKNPAVYLTAAADGTVSLQNARTDGSQDWQRNIDAPTSASLTPDLRSTALISMDTVDAGGTLALDAASPTPNGGQRNAGTTGTVFALVGDGSPQSLGKVSFDDAATGSVTLPASLAANSRVNVAVLFDGAPTLWDEVTVTAPVVDTTKPQTTLVSPNTSGPFPAINVSVSATDDGGLQRIVANIYRDGKLIKSTQTAAGGATSVTHAATVALPDGDYVVKYNAQDLAGSISQTRTVAVTIDATKPTVTVKDGASFTVGGPTTYDKVSFKLHDAGKIDKAVINGVVKDLTSNTWSDLNDITPGIFGAVRGDNTLVVFDVAGNSTTQLFILR